MEGKNKIKIQGIYSNWLDISLLRNYVILAKWDDI
jgi:hypothetical protein